MNSQMGIKSVSNQNKATWRWILSIGALSLIAVVILGKSRLQVSEGPYGGELACLESLSERSQIHGSIISPSVGVIQGSRAFDSNHQDEGLIVFSHQKAYFVLLPKPIEESRVSHYYLELNLPSHSSIYLNYSVEPALNGQNKALFTASDSPSPEIADHYVLVSPDEISLKSASKQIQENLSLGIQSLRKKHDLKLAMHQFHPHYFDLPEKVNYEKTLTVCEKIKNHSLQAAIRSERTRLNQIPDQKSLVQSIRSTLGI